MLNEIQEFEAYTQSVRYEAASRNDTTYLGRFTLPMILNFDGMLRILTMVARGYMHETAVPNVERARNALCAWCSIPDSKNATPGKEWQYRTDFRNLHKEFPELVDENGAGWFSRHVHAVSDFILHNPDKVRKGYEKDALAIQKKFDRAWRDKVRQFQTPIFSASTKGAWILRFDDVLADAMEQGKLQNNAYPFPEELTAKLLSVLPKEVPVDRVQMLISYYHAHRQEDTDWVVLPTTAIDAYYGNSTFSGKVLPKIPQKIMVRERLGKVSRFQLQQEYRLENVAE